MSEEKKTRKKASANYALENCGGLSAEGTMIWFEVKDGFVSPEAALAHAKEKQIIGKLRVVRAVTPVLEADVVRPEPVYVIKKPGSEKPKFRAKKKEKTKEDGMTNPQPTAEQSKPELAFPPVPVPVYPETPEHQGINSMETSNQPQEDEDGLNAIDIFDGQEGEKVDISQF